MKKLTFLTRTRSALLPFWIGQGSGVPPLDDRDAPVPVIRQFDAFNSANNLPDLLYASSPADVSDGSDPV